MKFHLIICLLLLVACSQPQIEARPERPIIQPQVQEDIVEEVVVESTNDLVVQTADIDDLKSILLKGIEGTQYHVTLDVTVVGNTNIKSVTEIYVKDNKSRVDTKADIDNTHIETRVVILEEQMISCINEGDWECETFPVDSEIVKLTAQQMREQLDNSSFYTAIKRVQDRKLAGVVATCYIITLPQLPSQEQCYSNEGAVLYQEFEIEGDHVVHKASAYSTTVLDTAFKAPN